MATLKDRIKNITGNLNNAFNLIDKKIKLLEEESNFNKTMIKTLYNNLINDIKILNKSSEFNLEYFNYIPIKYSIKKNVE